MPSGSVCRNAGAHGTRQMGNTPAFDRGRMTRTAQRAAGTLQQTQVNQRGGGHRTVPTQSAAPASDNGGAGG